MPDHSAKPPPPPPSPPRHPLKAFGGYEIEGELGRGGMGVVYLARQVELNRHVALKMLTGHYGANELRRFLEEAETAAGLSHSNIAHIYEVGEHEGAPFFSMEYVENGSLADRLRKDLPSPQDAAQLLIPVARALHFAHQNGVVHRDMKPANVLIDQDGVPKVADFGIAKRLKDDISLTRSGAVIGTPTYMAPEQAKGHSRHVGPAADIYSLGAILYEMLTGRPPFLPEDSETAITVRVLTEDPVSPAWHRPETPRDLETICMKCLEKEPRARYASAAALAEDLQRFLDDESILARPPNTVVRSVKWARRHPWKVVASALLVILLVAGVLEFRHWLLYERLRTEYAATVKTVRGRMEPGIRLTPEEAARREISFRLTRRGLRGPITRVEVVNSRGRPAVVRQVFNYDVLLNWLEGVAGMQKQEERAPETSAIEFDLIGGEVEATALDRNQIIIWRMVYDHQRKGESRHVARFVDLHGYDFGLAQGASQVEFERDAAGRDVRALFKTGKDQAATNGEGVYGYALEWDNKGQLSRLINLGRDGNPGLNLRGVGGFGLTYNPLGQLSQITYLGVDGKPALFDGIAAATYEYDGAGNVLHLRFLDFGNRLANSSARFAAIDYTRDEHGETTEIVWRRVKPDGELEIASRMTIEYDPNGYPSDVRSFGETTQRTQFTHDPVGNITEERLFDLEGKPVAGEKGWSIRRKSYSKTTDPPGWREEETYFDARGEKTYHTSGHHRTIIEFNEVGQIRLFVNEDHDPRRFSYYRYVLISEYEGRKTRRTLSRFENKDGQLATKLDGCASTETFFDDEGREVTKWERGCNPEVWGAPIFRTDTEWYKSGARKRLVREACDDNGKPLTYISGGMAARFDAEFDENNGRAKHIYEQGFDEKLIGFSEREAVIVDGNLKSVTHKRSDGSALAAVNVYIKSVTSEQAKAAELHAGDQLIATNGTRVTSLYAWQSIFTKNFPGGWIEVLRAGRRMRIDGFAAGKLDMVLEERAPPGKQ